jgi:DNA-binding protein HU-beta
MKKHDLIAAMAAYSKIDTDIAGRGLEGITQVITRALKNGESITLFNFGHFSCATRVAHKGHNPQNGVEIDIPEARLPRFKPAKALKIAIR